MKARWEPGWTGRMENALRLELGDRVMEYVLNENYRVPYRMIPWVRCVPYQWYVVS